MKKLLFSLLLTSAVAATSGQRIYTKNGHISFFSKTDLENIKADNNQVMSVLNTSTGELQFSVQMKSFHFPKALMEEHFNENYMESDKFPKAIFKGQVTDIAKVKFDAEGTYPVTVSGDLTIHGVTHKLQAPGSFSIRNGLATGTAKFMLTVADYNISIPKLMENNISKKVEVTVNCLYDQKM